MKRFFFSSIALMVAMTACTESGLIDAPEFYGNPIVFDTYIGKTPVTKAQNWNVDKLQLAKANGGGAHILGFESDKNAEIPFSNVLYDSKHLDGDLLFGDPSWGYYEGSELTEAYMPASNDLAVVAYSLNASNKISVSDDSKTFTFTVADQVSEQVDLLVTPLTLVKENPNGGDTKVPLRFYHLLTRIGFKVQSENISNTDITIKSVKLTGNFHTTGAVDMTASKATPSMSFPGTNISLQTFKPKISPSGTAVTKTYELLTTPFTVNSEVCYRESAQICNASEPNCYMMIMPTTESNATIEVTYYLEGAATDNTASINIASLNDNISYFEAGYAYEFLFTFKTSKIDFSAEISKDWDWEEDEHSGIPVYPDNQ